MLCLNLIIPNKTMGAYLFIFFGGGGVPYILHGMSFLLQKLVPKLPGA